MRVRRALVASTLAFMALVVGVPPASPQDAAQLQRLIEAACSIPPILLERTLHGYRPDRAPEIQILTREPDWVGNASLPHAGPWDNLEQVPILWYGPGYVPATGTVDRRVTLADIAPTQAEFLRFDFHAPDGKPLREALVASADRPEPPRLLVTLVWDAGGWAVLQEHPDAWPNLRSLIDRGVFYPRAEVGSAPPATAQMHATIGTGAFSRTHGITSHHLRMGQRVAKPYELGPRYLLRPTLATLYDRAMGNRPLVAAAVSTTTHLGLIGHGALWGGGDRDIAVLRELEGAQTLGAEGLQWNLPDNLKPFYRFPAYANRLPPISDYFDEVDRSDGRLDGKWLGTDIDSEATLGGFHTPARIPYQNRLVEEIVRREGFGDDDVPDLLFINHKLIDHVGHVYSMNSPEMESSIRAEDAALPGFIDFLNKEVGKRRWVLTLTADHGSTPDPEYSGADVIAQNVLQAVLIQRFDTDGDGVSTIQSVQPTGVYVNERELASEGYSLDDVAEFLLGLTKGQLSGATWPIPAEARDEPAFLAAFPSRLFDRLPCLPAEDT